jgi:hypothetical protein
MNQQPTSKRTLQTAHINWQSRAEAIRQWAFPALFAEEEEWRLRIEAAQLWQVSRDVRTWRR